MIWKEHYNLRGKHALLGASKYHWIKYDDDEQFIKKVCSESATEVGTIIHAFAADRIKFGLKLNKHEKKDMIFELLRKGIPRIVIDSIDTDLMFDNLIAYVNDSIIQRMTPEVILYYSDVCFGTADAISFENNKLCIYDLKTGVNPAHMEQLEIYAALFCLEYKCKPKDISIELRIYQNNDVLVYNPESKRILAVTDRIIRANNFIDSIKEE